MYPDLACHDVLSTRDHVGASFSSEDSGHFGLVNESKKKLKCRLGSWGRPLKKVTFPSRPEGCLSSHCFSITVKNQKTARDLSTSKLHTTQRLPLHQLLVEASQLGALHICSQRWAAGSSSTHVCMEKIGHISPFPSYREVLGKTSFMRVNHASQQKNYVKIVCGPGPFNSFIEPFGNMYNQSFTWHIPFAFRWLYFRVFCCDKCRCTKRYGSPPKKSNPGRWWMCSLAWLWEILHSVYIYQIIHLKVDTLSRYKSTP